MARQVEAQEEDTINLTPMLDVVFIMLIFFIVTATFIKETGVEVNRPDTYTAEPKPTVSLLVAVAADSSIHVNKEKVDVRNVRPIIEQLHAENPKGGLVIQADGKAKTEKVLAVMEAARQAGIAEVAIASEEP